MTSTCRPASLTCLRIKHKAIDPRKALLRGATLAFRQETCYKPNTSQTVGPTNAGTVVGLAHVADTVAWTVLSREVATAARANFNRFLFAHEALQLIRMWSSASDGKS